MTHADNIAIVVHLSDKWTNEAIYGDATVVGRPY